MCQKLMANRNEVKLHLAIVAELGCIICHKMGYSDTPAEMRESAALLGQHNDEILGELNRDKETIDRLRAEEIIL